MITDQIEIVRRWFAEELRYTAHVESAAVVEAFARVPREHFVGPGPWRIVSPLRAVDYWTTEDGNPRHLCHDVVVAIDEKRRLNNGQPSLWANLYDQLNLAPGEHVIHVGVGTGYYSAILAEIVGSNGEITGVEIDAELAARARRNLTLTWPQVSVLTANGFVFRPERLADAIVVNAGCSHLSPIWLDSLAPKNGRLLVPLTTADHFGAFLLVTRQGVRYPARFIKRTGIIACTGGRDHEAETRLKAALQVSCLAAVRSLRRAPEQPDDTCWLAGDGWWLSTASEAGEDAGSEPEST